MIRYYFLQKCTTAIQPVICAFLHESILDRFGFHETLWPNCMYSIFSACNEVQANTRNQGGSLEAALANRLYFRKYDIVLVTFSKV